MGEKVAERERIRGKIAAMYKSRISLLDIARKVDRRPDYVEKVIDELGRVGDDKAAYYGARGVGIKGVTAYRMEGSDKWVSLPLIPSLQDREENPEHRRVVSRF